MRPWAMCLASAVGGGLVVALVLEWRSGLSHPATGTNSAAQSLALSDNSSHPERERRSSAVQEASASHDLTAKHSSGTTMQSDGQVRTASTGSQTASANSAQTAPRSKPAPASPSGVTASPGSAARTEPAPWEGDWPHLAPVEGWPHAQTPLAQAPLPNAGPNAVQSAGQLRLRPTTPDDGLTPEERVAVDVYENVNRSVVNISTKSVRRDTLFFFEVPSEGSGSGSVLDKKGHVLTNFHVIEGAREVSVTLHDGKTYEAALVGADPPNDIAVLKLEAPGEALHPVPLGDSARMKVGMRVYAIGNPFGLERTLTTGIVSSLNRSLRVRENRTIKGMIQIDAAINPGNSGGPLLDCRGHLIGMNTAIASNTGQSAGVGFAIPSNTIVRIVSELIQHGRVIRAEIGIRHVYATSKGLLIASLTPGGPAEQAGLRGPLIVRRRRGNLIYESLDRSAADVLTAVDGRPIKSAEDFLGHIESKRPGETAQVTVLREGKEVTIPVRLGESEP